MAHYCFTKYELKIKIIKEASQDLTCMHCLPEIQQPAIKKGTSFFWVEGFRTYTHMVYMQGQKPYIPRSIIEAKRLFNVDPKTFKDHIVNHEVCPQCMANFRKFYTSRASLPELKPGYILNLSGEHTKRIYEAKFEYNCLACGERIKKGQHYVRFGHYRCYCRKCISKVEGIIGTQYAY